MHSRRNLLEKYEYVFKIYIFTVFNMIKSCKTCEVGKYSLSEDNKAIFCNECPKTANCMGGDELILKPGLKNLC